MMVKVLRCCSSNPASFWHIGLDVTITTHGNLATTIYWGYINSMQAPQSFSSDPAKDAKNLVERGLSFDAVKAFEFDTAVVSTDDRRDCGEVREVAIGFIGERIHVVVFTMRGTACHVISLRKANKREIKAYVKALR